jgi:hypothetical protein
MAFLLKILLVLNCNKKFRAKPLEVFFTGLHEKEGHNYEKSFWQVHFCAKIKGKFLCGKLLTEARRQTSPCEILS